MNHNEFSCRAKCKFVLKTKETIKSHQLWFVLKAVGLILERVKTSILSESVFVHE